MHLPTLEYVDIVYFFNQEMLFLLALVLTPFKVECFDISTGMNIP